MEAQGDLGSVVLHSLTVTHAKNSFPVAVGAKVFAVDHNTFASNGEAYSVILPGETDRNINRVLQQDAVEMAYNFSTKVRLCKPLVCISNSRVPIVCRRRDCSFRATRPRVSRSFCAFRQLLPAHAPCHAPAGRPCVCGADLPNRNVYRVPEKRFVLCAAHTHTHTPSSPS